MESDRTALQNFCLDNSELVRLQSIVNQFNVFVAAGLTRQEIRHSKFLSFLLNPQAPHGIGSFFLERFLQTVLADSEQISPVSQLDLHLWDLDDTLVETERYNIDILITNRHHGLSVIIETKVTATEHSNQLQRYKQIVKEKFPGHRVVPIFLTSDGSQATDPEYIPASFEQVSQVLTEVTDRFQRQLSDDILIAINHYQELLKRHILQNSEIEELCAAIYQKHKQAIDLIIDNIGDDRKVISDRLCEAIEAHPQLEKDYFSKSLVKTCPKLWTSLIPDNNLPNDITYRVLVLMIRVNSDFVDICTNIQPGDSVVRERIFEVAKNNTPPYTVGNRKLSRKWCMVSKDILLTTDEMNALDPYALADLAVDRLHAFVENRLPDLTAPLREEFGTPELYESIPQSPPVLD